METVTRAGKVIALTGPQPENCYRDGKPQGKGKRAPTSVSRKKLPTRGNQSNSSFRAPYAECDGLRISINQRKKTRVMPRNELEPIAAWTARHRGSATNISRRKR